MVFSKLSLSKFKMAQIFFGVIILVLLILFISNRLVFLISVLNRVFSPGEPTTGKVEIDVDGLKLLEDKISFSTSSSPLRSINE